MFGFTLFDFLIGVVIALSLVMGFSRGFTHEALKLLAWAAAIFITVVALPFATEIVAMILPWEVLAGLVGLVVTFVVTLMLLTALGKWAGEQIRTSFIGPLDRSLGALFGFLRGALIVAAGFLAFTFFVEEEDEPGWIAEARFRGLAEYGAGMLADVTPDLFEGAKQASRKALDADGRAIMEDVKSAIPTEEEAAAKVKGEAAKYSDKAREELSGLIEQTTGGDEEENGGGE